MGEEKIYYLEGFVLPDSHGFYGEIQNGKDITKIIQSGQFNFSQGRITQDKFDELTQSIIKETFYFGTQNFLLLTSVRENL